MLICLVFNVHFQSIFMSIYLISDQHLLLILADMNMNFPYTRIFLSMIEKLRHI